MIPFTRSKTYLSNMADKIIGIREEKLLFDFKIHIKDDFLHCHKFIVALHSPYMKAMLTSDMAEVAKQETRLDHIDVDIVKIILAYMYTEDFSVHKDQLMDVITAADYLHMKELKEMCLEEVPAILEVGNVLEWWKICGKIDLDATKEHCEDLMATAFVEITKHREFLRLNHAEVTDYFNHVCGQIIERDDILKAAMYWVDHDATERLEYLDDLLQKIELDKCSMQGIRTVIKSYTALLDQQPMLYKVLSCAAMDDLCDSSASSEVVSSKPVKQHPQQQNKSVVVIVGGSTDHAVNRVCWKLNEKNQIEELCQIPAEDLARFHSVCKTPHGFIIAGGENSDLCLMFMAVNRSWVRMQNMRKTRRMHGSICVKSILFVIGGHQDGQKANSVEMIPIEGGCWQDGPNMPIDAEYPKVADTDESVYVLDQETRKLLHLDVNRKTWSAQAPFPRGRCFGVSMVSAQDKLFLAGGSDKVCAWYNIASNAWFMVQQPLQRHRYGALVHYDNILMLLGGSIFGDGTEEVEEYDIEADSWSMCHFRMPTGLYDHYALLLEVQ